MVNCPLCGKEMKASSLQAHLDNTNIHPQNSTMRSGTFGGQIGRAYDDNFKFTINDAVKPQSASQPGTLRILPKGNSQPVHVFRETGVPVVRKIGDRTRHPKEWA